MENAVASCMERKMKKPKNAVSGAIDAILSATDVLITNAALKTNGVNDRGARLARAERDVSGTSRSKLAATNRSAKLAEAERSVTQSATSPRNIAIYRALMARRGW
jgi:hypothetical protein